MVLNTINQIRESINLKLFGHKALVLRILKVLSILVSMAAIGSIVYFYGYPNNSRSAGLALQIIQFSFLFYILKFIIQVFYDFDPPKFIRANRFEATVIFFLLINLFINLLFNVSIIDFIILISGMAWLKDYSIVFLQLYFFIIFLLEVGKGSSNLAIFKLGPSALLTLSFVLLILAGSGLLMLPEMTIHGIRYIDALFTSTSASCVTGLITIDTATAFTYKGKLIIMLLIQLGGINIISFATFFTTFYSSGIGMKYQSLLKDLLSSQEVSSNKTILRDIIFFSAVIEIIGATLIYFSWSSEVYFQTYSHKIFYSVFHSISAFNNAGFTLFTNNIADPLISHNYNLQIVFMSLIFFGSLGFVALKDIFGYNKILDRWQNKWKRLTITTKIALRMSFLLIILGGVFFYILENTNTLAGHSLYGKIIVSLFHSISARTAGFNSIDFSVLGQPVLIIFMMLMFIGASPGSTGGGIKTTTFSVIIKSAIATIRGQRNVEMFKKNISYSLIDKAYSIALFSLSLIFVGTFILSITEPNFSLLQLMFEEISAFGTVGLSTGITSSLSIGGKTVIIITMFIGRIGTLSLALLLSREIISRNYKYADAHLMVG
jgi:potassium uptake TrkH family protein